MARILIDFDNTIANSPKAIYEIFKQDTGAKGDYNDNHGWNFEGLIPGHYLNNALKLFCEERMYKYLEAYDDAINIINELCTSHEVFIITKHTAVGIPHKDKWIRTNLPNVRVVYVDSFDKSIVTGDIFIDDKLECLNSVKNTCKHIWCYGNYKWNEEWTGKRVLNWKEVLRNIETVEASN